MLINLSGYLLYLGATFAGVGHKLAMSVIFSMGLLVGFFANKNITFRHNGSGLSAGYRFLAVNILGYLVNLGILLVFVDWLNIPHAAVQVFAIIVVAILNFLLFRFFVFA